MRRFFRTLTRWVHATERLAVVVKHAVYPVQMSWIDVAIASLVVISALRGWSQGALRQIGALLGRVIGLVGGSYLAATIAPRISQVAWRPLDVVLIIVTATVAGGLIMRFFGGVFSNRLREGRLGVIDSLLGASVGVGATVLTCWFVAAILSMVPWGSLGQSINHSFILRYVDRALPTPPAVEGQLQGVLDQINVPSLFADVVAPTLPGLTRSALGTDRHPTSSSGVVMVAGYGGCGISQQGTGFLVAPNEVVTAAHLVAGEKIVMVNARVGSVVLFDARDDLAVIRVPSLGEPPLSLGSETTRGTSGELVGYASVGHLVASRAFSLGPVSAPGRDIYSSQLFERTMDVVMTSFRLTQAGSPVIMNGTVVGVAVERAAFGSSFIYATPVAQLRADLRRVNAEPVSTGRCVN